MTCAGTGMHGTATSPVTKPLNRVHSPEKGCIWRGADDSFSLRLRSAGGNWKETALPLPALLLGLHPARADSPQIVYHGCAASVRWVVPAYLVVGHRNGHRAAEQRESLFLTEAGLGSAKPSLLPGLSYSSPLPATCPSSWPSQRQTLSPGDTH